MRNLKRVLSLTLASVMLLGMMVVGSSAAGYSDVDEEDNVEAIEVLQAVEVMVGDDRGFGPDRPVTRNEMAVVMGKLLNLDYNYYVSTCPFNDVANWARGWVGACYANGIVSGRGQGVYDGESTVTAIEAASMMMRALGYFKNIEDYADGFATVTVRQGSQIGIFNMVGTDATSPMTRNQVAQMALNALRSEMVDFTGTPGIEVNGVKVGYRAEYTPRTSTEAKYNAIEGRTSDVASDLNHKGQYYIQLGEELYDGDLRLYNNATDDFGRPSRKWEYDGKAIGTYMKKELLDKEWTVEVTGKDLYDLLGADTIKNYDIYVTIDGVDIDGKTGTTDHNTELKKTGAGKANSYFDETFMAKTYKSGVGQTGKGVLTQVFVDPDEGNTGRVWVSVINTYLAKATTDYSEKKDEVSFDVYALTSVNSSNNEVFYKYVDACKDKLPQTKKLTVSGDDFAVAADIKKDDIVLVTQANGTIKTISEPQVISAATLNGFSKDNYVVAEGTQYDYNTTVDYDPETLDDYTSISDTQQLKDTEYNVYLDQYGYLIGVEVVDAVKNYVFLTGIDNASSNLRNKTAEAAGILMDGTFVEFTMNLTDSEAYWTHGGYKTDTGNRVVSYADTASTTGKFTEGPLWNTWCTYTVDKNGVYTLKEVKNLANVTGGDKAKAGQYHDASYSSKDIDSKHISLKSADGSNYVYGNNNSVYIVAELESIVSHADITDVKSIKMPDANTDMKDVVTGNSTKVGIISGVDTVTTGIDNVNLTTWAASDIETELKDSTNINKAYPGNVYTLFDDDGYVMAAVVVGEDDGASKNLVYSHKDKIESEYYDGAADEWTWTRKVIFNGEEVTLTEKGSSISVLKNLKENVWYELTYKADGTVKAAEYVKYTDGGKRIGSSTSYPVNSISGPAMDLAVKDTTPGNFVNNIDALEYAINDGKNDSTTVYEQVWGLGTGDAGSTSLPALGENNAPSLVGNSLYMNTLEKRGFRVKDDVKTVFIQKNDGSKTTEYGSNISDLEDFLKDLNYNETNASYCFKISAIIDGSHASVVVIHDWNETGATTSGDRNPGGDTDAVVTVTGSTVSVTLNGETDMTKVADEIAAKLEAAGYTDVDVKLEGDEITGITAKKGNTTVKFKQAGDIEIVDPAVTLAADKVTVEGLTWTTEFPDAGSDPAKTVAQIKSAVETKVNGALSTGVTAAFTWDDTASGTKAAVNGADAGNTAKADGRAKVSIVLSKGGKTETVALTIAVKAMAYADTAAGKVAAALASAATGANGATLPNVNNSDTGYSLNDPLTGVSVSAVQTAVDAQLATDNIEETVTVSFNSAKVTGACADDSTDGTYSLTVTLSCTVGSVTDTQNVTIAGGTLVAKNNQ